MSAGDRWFLSTIYLFLFLVFIVVAYPMLNIVSTSFSSPAAINQGKVWLWPVQPTWTGYEIIFQYDSIWLAYTNSLIYMISGSVLSVALSVMMAYPLSRSGFVGKGIVTWAILFAMIFNGGLIPFYLTVKSLGLLNTMGAMIVPSALNIFAVIVAKTFFQSSIPGELYDAAEIDGCSDFKFMLRMVVPLSKPVIVVLLLWSAVYHWNSYFNALIFLSNPKLYPLQLILRQILLLGQLTEEAMRVNPENVQMAQDIKTLTKYSIIVVASAPMLLLYLLAQKYFVKGVMIGSIKS